MNSVAATTTAIPPRTGSPRPNLHGKASPVTAIVFIGMLAVGLFVAGTMAANKSGLQMATIRNLLMAWVLTLPAAILLSASLYWLFAHVF